MTKLGSCDNLIWEGLQYASKKAEERKQKTIKSFTLDELKYNPALRASVALRLGNIEIEKMIEEQHFKELN